MEKILWVRLRGGPPWGFRLRGGKGSGNALFIHRVNEKGQQQGVRQGDRVLSVNGRSALDMTLDEVQRQMRDTAAALDLQLQRYIVEPENRNGETQNGEMVYINALRELSNAGSWSTDSTSTGSTTIHVRPVSASDTGNVWSPNTKKRANLHLDLNCNAPAPPKKEPLPEKAIDSRPVEHIPEEDEKSPVWQPFGAPYDGPQFRPVKLSVAQRNAVSMPEAQSEILKKTDSEFKLPSAESSKPSDMRTPEPVPEARPDTPDPVSAPTVFAKSGWSSHLPPSQSPTITLLQKAREGQIPKGAIYIEEKSSNAPIPDRAVLLDQKVTVEGDQVHTDSLYAVPILSAESTTTHHVKAPSKYDGIGPTEYGIPVGLRTGVKEEYASDWYKSMFKSLHKAKFPNDTNRTVHVGGYMSEPEYERKDKLRTKYTSDYRRKPEKSITSSSVSHNQSSNPKISVDSVVRPEPQRRAYRVEPRSIADYEPGRSSLAEKEFQKFWSDFWDSMDDLQEHWGHSTTPRQGLSKRWPNVLLSDGYESDSMLIRKTGNNPDPEPDQQRAWYKEVQKGGEIPFTGLRKSVPEKPTASPHQYQETEVNIHYRSPIRHLEKDYIDDEELKRRQDEAMQKLYEEEKRKKQQHELAEIEMRKHNDFFTPSQKSPIPLNRYDNPFETKYTIGNRLTVTASKSVLPKTMARALYPFVAQSTRELSLSKGDIVYVRKQVDRNWLEGDHHGLTGLFPAAYVEVIPTENAGLQPRRALEGEARVRFNFRAQGPRELSLFKGERVVLTRRLDANWYEGRLGVKKGIFPVSYVDVIQEPGDISLTNRPVSPRPPVSPVSSPILNGSLPKNYEAPTFITSLRPSQDKPPPHLDKHESKSTITQSLHIDTYNEPIPYRSLYSYKPQNDDELELRDGDTVYVMEKCDDGWYVGTSLRTGLFGTFPGNYVERI